MRRTVLAAVAAIVGLAVIVAASLALTGAGSVEVGTNVFANRWGLLATRLEAFGSTN
ncbi:MAG: hypothetical protein ABR540_22530 [Acidimicrobiales bacterium]